MDFQKIKAQIQEYKKILSKPITDENNSRAGLEMQKNQAINSLEQLKTLEKSMLKNYSNLYLVVGAKDKLLKAFEDQNCFVADHLLLSKKVANHFWPQFKPGMSLNAFILEQINQFMDSFCQKLGLDTLMRPRLLMDQRAQRALQSEDEFVDLLESMFVEQLKNKVTDREGHVLQALATVDQLMKEYSEVDKLNKHVNFIVSVPSLNDDVVDAYKNLLSQNVYTATFKLTFDLSDDKKVVEAVKSVLKRKDEKEV